MRATMNDTMIDPVHLEKNNGKRTPEAEPFQLIKFEGTGVRGGVNLNQTNGLLALDDRQSLHQT